MHAAPPNYAMHNYAQLCTIMHNYAQKCTHVKLMSTKPHVSLFFSIFIAFLEILTPNKHVPKEKNDFDKNYLLFADILKHKKF